MIFAKKIKSTREKETETVVHLTVSWNSFLKETS